jgi:hypothetical protein
MEEWSAPRVRPSALCIILLFAGKATLHPTLSGGFMPSRQALTDTGCGNIEDTADPPPVSRPGGRARTPDPKVDDVILSS